VNEKFADVEFPHSPDGAVKIHLQKKTVMTEKGSGT